MSQSVKARELSQALAVRPTRAIPKAMPAIPSQRAAEIG